MRHFIASTLVAAAAAMQQIQFFNVYTALQAGGHRETGPPMVDFALPMVLRWAFSCVADEGNYGCSQSSYQVQLFESGTGRLVKDSSVTMSSDPHFSVPSGVLSATMSYAWRVRVQANSRNGADLEWDAAPIESAWSANQSFFTGTSREWDATPIWAPRNSSGGQPRFAFLRRTLPLPQEQKLLSALAFVTANPPTSNKESQGKRPPKILGAYKLWVGDSLIGMGPGRARCGPLHCPYGDVEQVYDGFDVTAAVAAGGDTLDLFVSAFGLDQSHDEYPSGTAKVSLELRLVYKGAESELVVRTDGAWNAYDADGPYRPEGNSGCSWYYYPQENFNASAMPSGTPLSPTASARSSALGDGWQSAEEQAVFPAPMVAKPTAPVAVLEDEVPAVLVRKVADGHFFFDLGQDQQGGFVLRVVLPPALAAADAPETGRRVTVRIGEELKDGLVMYPPRTRMHQQSTWTLAATTEEQVITYHEYTVFRYGELFFGNNGSTSPSPAPPVVIQQDDFKVSAWVVRQPADRAAGACLESSDDTLNAVWELCRRTIKITPLDLYTDSNARQRSADCVADDVTAMRSHYATSSQLAMQRYATEQLLANGPDGRVDWAVLPIIAMHDHVMHTGDVDLAASHFDHLLSAHATLDRISKVSGLVEGIEGLVDWPKGMQDDYTSSAASTISSAWVYYGATTLAKLARLLRRDDDASSLEDTAKQLKAKMNAKQWNGTVFCDGVCTETPHTSFHSTMYALAFGCVEDGNVASAWNFLQTRTQDEDGVPCSSYAVQFALGALYAHPENRGAAALNVLTSDARNSWVAMLKHNATVTMEMWDTVEKDNLDWSHPWSSSPAFIVPWHLFGIRPSAPGFATVDVKPQPGNLPSGAFTLPSVRGPIVASFAQTSGGKRFELNVTLPASCVANVSIPLPEGATSRFGNRQMQLLVDGAPVGLDVRGHFATVEGVGPGGMHTFILEESTII